MILVEPVATPYPTTTAVAAVRIGTKTGVSSRWPKPKGVTAPTPDTGLAAKEGLKLAIGHQDCGGSDVQTSRAISAATFAGGSSPSNTRTPNRFDSSP